MARQFQTQTVTAPELIPGDFVLRGNGKYRRVLVADNPTGTSWKVRYNPNGADWFTSTQDLTIKHRDPRCACGCGQSTRGGIWAPGHDGRVAGIGARAITGDTEALRQLASAMDFNTLPTGRPSEIEHNPEADCDASCQFAHRELCVCSCGGTGHYMGWVRLGGMALAEVPEVFTPQTRREVATYVYTEGRREAQSRGRITSGPLAESWGGSMDAHTVISPNYAEEDLDAYIRRVIPVEPEVSGDCPKSGEFVDATGRIDCPECGRSVAVRSNGRVYAHQTPTAEVA